MSIRERLVEGIGPVVSARRPGELNKLHKQIKLIVFPFTIKNDTIYLCSTHIDWNYSTTNAANVLLI